MNIGYMTFDSQILFSRIEKKIELKTHTYIHIFTQNLKICLFTKS